MAKITPGADTALAAARRAIADDALPALEHAQMAFGLASAGDTPRLLAAKRACAGG